MSAALHEVLMPRVSDTMTEGIISRWLKAEGDGVAAGEALAEVETDKATVELEAPADGIVLRVLLAEGEALEPGGVVAVVGPAGAELPERQDAPSPPEPAAEAAPDRPASVQAVPGRRLQASPLAKRVAAEAGLELAAVGPGSGPTGRILREDVERAIAEREGGAGGAPVPLAASEAPARGGERTVVQELTRVQAIVARRMSEAKATAPDFQVWVEVGMDAALALRAQLKAAAAEGEAVPSVNDLIVKASALALRKHPRANGAYREGRFELYPQVNVGFAVAADDSLVVPTIAEADTRSLRSIAAESRRLAERVREATITAAELSGGTFTVSNLGMLGVSGVAPVINLPQAAILGVGATRSVLARDESGEIVDRQELTLTLTCDHRILYGADAARLLSDLRDLLEQPLRLV